MTHRTPRDWLLWSTLEEKTAYLEKHKGPLILKERSELKSMHHLQYFTVEIFTKEERN